MQRDREDNSLKFCIFVLKICAVSSVGVHTALHCTSPRYAMNEDRVSSVQNKAKLLCGASCCSGTRGPVLPTAIYILLSRREKSKSGPRFGRNERNTRYMRAGNSPEHLYNLRDNPSRWRGAELTSPVFIREASPRVESLEFCSLVLRTRAQFRLMISHVFRPLSSKLRLKYNSPRIL